MPEVTSLGYEDDFPPTSEAMDYPNGLLAVGGNLSPQRLIKAYQLGIFPWYEEPQPILWWTPDPRSVLYPAELHISRSLTKTLRKNCFSLSVDQQFESVMRLCGSTRTDGPGTWINERMVGAYRQLHEQGIAHSVEVSDASGHLVGGLYGLALGRVFFGESMFSLATDASKVALVGLVNILLRGQFELIDCQVESVHMNTMGARNLSRLDFEAALAQTVHMDSEYTIWHLPRLSAELL